MNLTINLILCGVLVVITVGVYLYHRWLENHCDNYIHLHNDSHDSAITSHQTMLCKRLEAVDKAKYALLVAVILYILAIVGMALYTAWNTSAT
jgi:hypothetical protein